MMTIYGAMRNGKKVVIMWDGSGYEYVSYVTGARKQKTPLANGAENRTALNCYEQHNAANAGVKKFSALA